MLREEWEQRQRAPEEQRARWTAIQDEVNKLDGELTRLAEAIAIGGDIPQLVSRMAPTKQRRDELVARAEHLEGHATTQAQGTLEADPRAGRILLRGLLATPFTMTPVLSAEGRVTDWEYTGLGTLDQLVTGRLSTPTRIPKSVTLDLKVPEELFTDVLSRRVTNADTNGPPASPVISTVAWVCATWAISS